jgi:predicted nucleotidyltransferase
MVKVVWGRAKQRAAELAAELERITPLLRGLPGIERAYVFGSTVSGGVHASSDLDLLVVRRTAEPFVERGITLDRELGLKVSVDLFVYTPEEFQRGGRVIDHALATGRRLW